MRYFLSKLMLLGVMTTFLICCKGKDGDIGPAGPKGASGPSAASYNFNLSFSSSAKTAVYSGLPLDVSSNDVILVYVLNRTISNTQYWVLLPYTQVNSYTIYSEVVPSVGLIAVTIENGNGDYPFSEVENLPFKAVVIKGNAGAKKAFIDYNNYNEVKAYYKLKD